MEHIQGINNSVKHVNILYFGNASTADTPSYCEKCNI